MRRPLQFLLLLSVWCGSAERATAQLVLDPGFLEFTASADHSALDDDGLSVVTRYEFLLYTRGSSTPLRVVNLGKPAPNSAGTIRIALSTILVPLPAGGIEYEVRIAAVGSNGSSASTPSNTFAYQLPCSYAVTPTSRSLGSSAASTSFSVTAPIGCAWTAASAATWISITNGSSGIGNGTVNVSVASNSATSQRSGSLTIAGHSVSVTQAGAACTFSVSPTSQSVPRTGGSASFAVTTSTGCTWSASEQSSWLSITSGGSGTGGGTVRFTVAAHTGTSSRSTSATVAGRTITISQPAIGTAPAPPTGFRIVSN